MEIVFSQNLLVLVGLILLFSAAYSGFKTYHFLKKYIDVMLLLRSVDTDSKVEEYSIRISETQSQLIPWGLSYVLNIVLFTIIIYIWIS